MQGFLLDTSALNRICDGKVGAERLRPLYITDVVFSELVATQNPARREALLRVLLPLLGPGSILRGEGEAAAHWTDDFAEYGAVESPAQSLGRTFPLITRTIGTNFRKHWRDGFIAQVALTNGLTLVTADRALARAARKFGVTVEFIPPPGTGHPHSSRKHLRYSSIAS